MKHCPECQRALQSKTHKIFRCFVCPDGHGTLYPKGELEKIVKVLAGLGDLEMRIWNDHERYTVIPSDLFSPEGSYRMLEIRDRDFPNIMVYGDPETHALWLHTGEEEKLVEHIEREAKSDAISTYLMLAAGEASKIFDDEEPLKDVAGHTLTSLKLLGERILRALPTITF